MSLIASIVAFCCRRPRAIVLLSLVAAAVAGFYTSLHFSIDTNSEHLVSNQTNWRQREIHFDKLFPQNDNLILVVVDGTTAERAEYGAAKLSAALAGNTRLFSSVRRPDGGAFFDHNGLLFLPLSDVKATTQQLIQAQAFLGAMAADPSLRGVMGSLNLMLEGVAHGQAKLSDIQKPMHAFADTLGHVAKGKKAFLSWRSLVTGSPLTTRDTRRFIEAKPRLDFDAIQPGQDAEDAIRATAKRLGLTPDEGIRVRLTGPVPMADEEFGTLAEHGGLMVAAMFTAVLVTLWLAVRSFRIILCILATLFTGLAITMGAGLAAVGVFNIISIAFVALFVGLGVDFGIQFSVRYRDERHHNPNLPEALRLAGLHVGQPLALAAAATAAGFFSFLPTNYIGVAGLGLVAGIGMIVAFVLSVTMLPALLMLIKPVAEPESVGFPIFAPVDRFIARNRIGVLRSAFVIAILALALVPSLRFDFNPLDLRSRHVESVSTLFDLMKDPQTSPNTIDVLVPSLAAAGPMADRLSKIPEVGQVVTLTSFVPDDQPAKIAAIQDADTLLDATLNPFVTKPPPSDAENVAALKDASGALRAAAASDTTPAKADALTLAATLDRIAAGGPALRAGATDALVPGLDTLLDQVRASLTPQAITLKTLPPDFVRDWMAPDGSVRLQVFPKDGAPDNASLQRFSDAVLAVVPGATGTPVSIQDYGKTIVRAFIQAGILSAIVITILLLLVLRRLRDVFLTLMPLALTGLLTLATCVVIGLQLNFANVIALPLLLGVGVAFDIYFIVAWRQGAKHFLQSALARAVIFSALTTASGFGTLWLSSHPGTASMGELLMISLGWTLATTLFFLPALLDEEP
jgi:hopanoid biosynthesis associated RND transporter like protein HpnN